MRYGFGVDLGGTMVKIAYFDENGTMLGKWEIPIIVDDEGRKLLSNIAASIRQFLAQKSIAPDSIVGVGVGVPGPVNAAGVVNKCVNLGWGRFNIAEELSKLLGFPVKAGNDANVAALGECWKGGGRGSENMIFAALGTGVGGGIVIGGRLLYGAHGSAAEIGHLVINRDEPEPCNCGKHGCMEQYCSSTGIVRMAQRILNQSNAYSKLRQHNPLTCRDIFACGRSGDELAERVLNQYYAYLGEALANLCDMVDPEAVVLGGGISKAGQMLLDGVRPHFDRHVFHAASGARFALASLGNDAGVYGAFKLVLDAFG
ncbi:MAG: ROK family glucokinase [Oscillospiraceae bacterium]|nr:ROK family glucokinase [Oscillospiraceae bacterium]